MSKNGLKTRTHGLRKSRKKITDSIHKSFIVIDIIVICFTIRIDLLTCRIFPQECQRHFSNLWHN